MLDDFYSVKSTRNRNRWGVLLKNLLLISAISLTALSACSSKVESPDLGQVLDRTVYAMEYYTDQNAPEAADTLTDEKAVDATEEVNLDEFTNIMMQVMNASPNFYSKFLGVALEEDASFTGFDDKNYDNVKDSGEEAIFTVEIDAENSRLIATDIISGEATTIRASGTGFIAGALVGRLLGRQRAAGVKPSSFASRTVSQRSAYDSKRKSTTSARSRTKTGSSRAGK